MIAIVHDTGLGEGDVVYEDGLLLENKDLETAVYLSLFIDAPAKPDDDVPTNAMRRGFWADAFADDGDIAGSRLWLLDREKATNANARRAEYFAREALAWMTRDGVASAVNVSAEIVSFDATTKGVAIRGEIIGPTGTAQPFGPWEVFRGVR